MLKTFNPFSCSFFCFVPIIFIPFLLPFRRIYANEGTRIFKIVYYESIKIDILYYIDCIIKYYIDSDNTSILKEIIVNSTPEMNLN